MKPHLPRLERLFFRVLPFLVVGGLGALVLTSLFATKKEVEDDAKEALPRVVRAVEAVPSSRQIKVISQGNVEPKSKVVLQAEVSGRIIEVSENFVVGGFFKKGEVLVKIDPRDYELSVVRAEARVAEASQRLMREEAEAAQARKEWDELGSGEASPLVLREPQLMEAQARLKSAGADLSEARLRLERTEIRAPFDGRVTGKNFEVGQIIAPGMGATGANAAAIYALAPLEVRLPLTDRQIALLDLPLHRVSDPSEMLEVSLETVFAGEVRRWAGRIVRTEGVIDTASRVLYAVARIEDPISHGPNGGIPIAVGMFVEAQISGRTFDNVVVIPRQAVRQDGTVLVVSKDSRLHFRNVKVLQSTRDDSYVEMTIEPGERICISPIDMPTENMPVTVIGSSDVGGDNLAGEVTQ